MKYNFYPFTTKGDYKVALLKENKVVIERGSHFMSAPYNGYVAFPCNDIPKDWWGDYNAGALQYLDIHGGITFCECYINDAVKNEEYIDKTRKKLARIKAKDETSEGFMKKHERQMATRLRANRTLAMQDNTYIVFGFDCGHLHDADDRRLYNPEYVMELVEKMEQQLLAYAKVYDDWKKASREKRIEITEKLVGQVDTHNMGIGGLLNMMMGGKAFGEKEV